MYAQRAWSGKASALQSLRNLTPVAAKHLETNAMYDVTQELFSDILTNYPSFLLASDYELMANILCSPALRLHASSLTAGDFESDSLAFGRLLLAFGDATVQDIATNTDDPLYEQIKVYLVGLLMCKGYAVVEDEICAQALEFWTTYVEFLTDALFAAEDKKPPWMDHAKDVVRTVLAACLAKVQAPPPTNMAFGDAEARTGFRAFRGDVEDLVQSSYNLFGLELLDGLVKSVLGCLANQSWYEFEAGLFFINALSDSVSNSEGADRVLIELFNSSAFAIMTKEVDTIPVTVEQTVVAMINRYTWFFEKHNTYLPGGLNFLFETLKSPKLASGASKSILGMCSSCRRYLTSELGAFLLHFQALVSSRNIDSVGKERLSGAVAAIIQALPSEIAKITPLNRLLDFVEADVDAALQLHNEDSPEEGYMRGLCALRCLVSMGKGSQVPDDVPIDLDNDAWRSSIWMHKEGRDVQERITNCYKSLLRGIGRHGDFIEATCDILRTGYTETTPGPFVMPPQETRDLFLLYEFSTTRVDYVLETAGVMLSRMTVANSDEMMVVATQIFGRCLQYLSVLGMSFVVGQSFKFF